MQIDTSVVTKLRKTQRASKSVKLLRRACCKIFFWYSCIKPLLTSYVERNVKGYVKGCGQEGGTSGAKLF